jgi:Zn-dependent protease
MDPQMIFFIVILIFSVIIHEISHGYVAEMLGDPTARMAGRLTLNPVPHIDPLGSIILPILLIMSGTGFVFGWAKPVPYNPYNLKDQKWGPALVAAAGPLSNIFIATIFGLALRFSETLMLSTAFVQIFYIIVLLNIVLAVFNMIPVPPLDGSKVLFATLPYKYYHYLESLEKYGFIVLLAIVFFGWQFIQPIIGGVFYLITGSPLVL